MWEGTVIFALFSGVGQDVASLIDTLLHLNTGIKYSDFKVVFYFYVIAPLISDPFVVKWSKPLPVVLIFRCVAVRLLTTLPECHQRVPCASHSHKNWRRLSSTCF